MKKKIKVLNLIPAGAIGGTETLCMNAAGYSQHDNTYMFLWKSGPISDEMTAKGYKVEVLNTSVQKYLKDGIKIARLCKKRGYDIVICHSDNPFLALCSVLIRLLSRHTHIIGYAHSSLDDWNKKFLISANVIFCCAEKVICISDAVLDSVKRHLGYDDKLVRIYNGVDISKFRPPQETVEKTGSRLIYVGRLTKGKGVQVLLHALKQVTAEYHLDIVGDGAYRERLEAMTHMLGLEKKVTFCGSQLDVRSFLSRSDIFIHVPTLEEGFGMTVVEAMAAGLLCICSKSGRISELIEDGVTGYLVDKDDSDRLAKILQAAIVNYNSEENLAMRHRSLAKAKEFSIDAYATAIDRLSDGIVLRGGGGVNLIYVGRLEKVKGVQTILNALAQINDIPYRFRIAGDGSYRQELEELTKRLGLADKVEFLGERRDIPELLWDADVFVHLPKWQEGFGLTVIEAMAAGKICIVNDHGAMPELITDEVDGYILREGERDLKQTLQEIYSDLKNGGSKVGKIRKNAMMEAKNFSIENYVRNMDALVAETVGECG